MKQVFIFGDDGESLGVYFAQESPLEPGVFLVPDKSTEIEPPTAENKKAFFLNGNWVLLDDYRGATIYNQISGIPLEVDAIGPLPDGYALTPPTPIPPSPLEVAKAQREAAVAAIKVTTAAGHTYDGDEVSINRMTAAITVLMATGGTVPWVLADNSIVSVNAAELTEALALSAAEVARLWVLPYAD